MTGKTAYSYTILRYFHDALTGEFVNVGSVLYVPASGLVRFKVRSTVGRLRGVFPDLERTAFISAMRAARRGLERIAGESSELGLFGGDGDASSVARLALPADDSSLQWSPSGSGLTDDPERTLIRIFERFVTRYDAQRRDSRTDDEVWLPVRTKLVERNLADRLQEKSVRGAIDDIHFKHAWKNGQWNVYEPLSFDLADAEGIKGKAREWLGHLSAVVAGGSAERFKPHFFVGAPSNPALTGAFMNAIAILRTAPNDAEVYQESQLESLVAKIDAEVREHDAVAQYADLGSANRRLTNGAAPQLHLESRKQPK